MSSHAGPLDDTCSSRPDDRYRLEFLFIVIHFALIITFSCKYTKVGALR